MHLCIWTNPIFKNIFFHQIFMEADILVKWNLNNVSYQLEDLLAYFFKLLNKYIFIYSTNKEWSALFIIYLIL